MYFLGEPSKRKPDLAFNNGKPEDLTWLDDSVSVRSGVREWFHLGMRSFHFKAHFSDIMLGYVYNVYIDDKKNKF